MAATASPIEIFRAGTHTATSGRRLVFSADDLAAIAAAYDPARHEAPVVVGHPETDAPAYGWVAALATTDGRLQASVTQLDPEFAELVREGRFKKISAAFYAPDAPANPTPGTWHLKHVGFLGAAAPAVKGLKQAHFSADEAGIERFATPAAPATKDIAPMDQTAAAPPPGPRPDPLPDPLPDARPDPRLAEIEARARDLAAREAAFAERAAAQRRAEDETFVAGLVRTGRLAQGLAPLAARLLAGTDTAASLQFAEAPAPAETAHDAWRRLLAALPPAVEFGELAAGEAAPAPAGSIEAITAAADALIKQRSSAGQTITFREAVLAVSKETRA